MAHDYFVFETEAFVTFAPPLDSFYRYIGNVDDNGYGNGFG